MPSLLDLVALQQQETAQPPSLRTFLGLDLHFGSIKHHNWDMNILRHTILDTAPDYSPPMNTLDTAIAAQTLNNLNQPMDKLLGLSRRLQQLVFPSLTLLLCQYLLIA